MAGIYLGNGERDLCYHSIMSAYQMTKAAGQSCELARYSAFLSTFLVHEQLRYGSSSQLLGRSHMHAQEALDILNRKVECGNEDHETALLVRYRCSQYAVQTSRWKMARKLLHKTRWICDFLMRDVMFNKTIRLQLVVAYFCGNLSKFCNVMPRWMTTFHSISPTKNQGNARNLHLLSGSVTTKRTRRCSLLDHMSS